MIQNEQCIRLMDEFPGKASSATTLLNQRAKSSPQKPGTRTGADCGGRRGFGDGLRPPQSSLFHIDL